MTLPGLLPENEAAWVPAEFKSINHHQSSSIIINHHQSSSIIINHHQSSSIIINHRHPHSKYGSRKKHNIGQIGQIGHFPKKTNSKTASRFSLCRDTPASPWPSGWGGECRPQNFDLGPAKTDGPWDFWAATCCKKHIPIGSMYGIYANIGGILMVNVTIYSSTMDPMW